MLDNIDADSFGMGMVVGMVVMVLAVQFFIYVIDVLKSKF